MMFTEFARHQHPNTFPHQLHSPSHPPNSYDPRNDPFFNTISDHGRGEDLQDQVLRKKFQKPSQYAHPLQNPSSVANQTPLTGLLPPRANNAEHMLRRKTPNGTLAAGYDGTPVEWTTKPHASKHLLMPTSDLGPQTAHNNLSLSEVDNYSPLNRPETTGRADGLQFQHLGGKVFASPQDRHGFNIPTEGDRTNNHVRPNGPPPPSLDSMLHQASIPHQFYSIGGFQQVPTVLQPMWPPYVGPTASNASGPYGPYWPNGSFEPYRPAALRDGRFHSQFANFSINDPPEAKSIQQEHTSFPNQPFLNPYRNGTEPLISSGQWQAQGYNTTSMDELLRSQDDAIAHDSDNSVDAVPVGNEQIQLIPLAYRAKSTTPNYPPTKPDNSMWSLMPPPALPISSHSTERSMHAHNLQFKEKALVWAHRIYLDLLSSIHQSRKHNYNKQHHGERHQVQHIFPKPPRNAASALRSMGAADRNDVHGTVNRSQEKIKSPVGHDHSSNVPSTVLENRSETNRDFQWPYAKSVANRHDHHGRGLRIAGRVHAHQIQDYHKNAGHSNPSPFTIPGLSPSQQAPSPTSDARAALELLARLAQESGWKWTDGLLLGGCLAYGLADYEKALQWYSKVLECNPNNVEAISNMAATLLSLNQRKEAEQHWFRSVKLRPSYFEAVEHLVGLLCEDQRGREAVKVIDFVENSLRIDGDLLNGLYGYLGDTLTQMNESSNAGNFHDENATLGSSPIDTAFGFSGYRIPDSDNGRMVALIHAKGNMLYALGDNVGAAKAFEDAIMIGAGRNPDGITGLIKRILRVFSNELLKKDAVNEPASCESVLLKPDMALQTAQLVFPVNGELPGLQKVQEGQAKRAAISTTSNSLLSLAKIYQDGMSSSGATANGPKGASGVQDILALYYLSLSLQPSPSTANNVGILLASVQQTASQKVVADQVDSQTPMIPGVWPGSGIALALAYYNYGLNLDSRHAHLYTNLGSLLKDIGQLTAAIKMYEQAVACDGNFDIALANLANAVKDQGRISDAIGYYKRAVASNGDFAEAVCGLANALNSVCSWKGRGGIVHYESKQDRWHVDEQGMLLDARVPRTESSGWIGRVVAIVDKQLKDGQSWGKGILRNIDVNQLLTRYHAGGVWTEYDEEQSMLIMRTMSEWAEQDWEGAKVVRLVERATKRLGWQLYQDRYIQRRPISSIQYARPQLPAALAIPSAPTVLPFHTFTCPLTAIQIRKISQRNGLRISCSTLRAPWLPAKIFDPPAPPSPHLNVGYVSSDFNNHPLAHLMQSVFGFHDTSRVKAFCYATTASDHSVHREQIQREAPVFYDVSSWSVDRLVNQIVSDGVHILINLNGYTRGARNEVFAARPAPIQMSFMGFAGTLGAEWCDYLLADTVAIPPKTLRPSRRNVDVLDQTNDDNNSDKREGWVYGENIIYTRDTFFCCDHRQSAPDSREKQLSWPEEQQRRWRMRKELFPDLSDDTVILGNFNQLYKIEPTTFRTWLRILMRIPKSILWLLRFPDLGESNLRQTALLWAGAEVAGRIKFTDVAPKHQHIARARVCDLFLDTPECNAHTTAADVLWSGTPLLTFPRYEYKMCSRMAASILKGALPKSHEGDEAWDDLVVGSDEEYEERAVELGSGLAKVLKLQRGHGRGGTCRLTELRKMLYESRWTSALFNTRRWVRDLEEAYDEAWRRWVAGEGGDIWL